jgi:futalosine hydrolase
VNILLVSATEFEVAPLIRVLCLGQTAPGFYSGKSNLHKFDCLITGIGSAATTYSLTKILQKSSYKLLVNAGVAGTYDPYMPVGSVVEVVADRFADFGIDDNGTFRDVYEESLVPVNTLPFLDGWIRNTNTLNSIGTLVKTTGITVNTVSGSQQRIDLMQQKYNPGVETMEGAAFFYVASQEKVQFHQIRAISNRVEPRNKKNWNISLAIQNLNSTLIDTFGSF